MSQPINDFVLHIATTNGSGSQSANYVLVRTLFRMGIPVGGKNLFPSNIQGLPTWFTIRAHPKGYVSRRPYQDIVVTLNPATAREDQKDLRAGGLFLFSSDCKLDRTGLRPDVKALEIPMKDLTGSLSTSPKARKLLTNMIYVGVFAEILELDEQVMAETISHQFGGKPALIEANHRAVEAGRGWARTQNLKDLIEVRARSIPVANENQVLLDGNTAGGMGLVAGGCTFGAWYPITPSTSVMEGMITYFERWRKKENGQLNGAIVQAEDELAAIAMVVGAGWAGARAATATSGPGLSLMAEAAGLAYYAEIPAVIWNVQRVGPSTGLPTRTMQGDVTSAYQLSHGDTKHVLLFPSSPKECFEFGQTALDLAERLQTLVIVMSDLDLGMNLHQSEAWTVSDRPFDRGRVLNAQALNEVAEFARYRDENNDGIGPRTLPGTAHPKANYFTRGTGHDELSRYSEDPEVFKRNMDRLDRKWETAKQLVPAPIVDLSQDATVGILAFGSSDGAMAEIRDRLTAQGVATNYLRLRALPFTRAVEDFLENHERIYVVEQNRDGQMRGLLSQAFPKLAPKLRSSLTYDGWPLAPELVSVDLLKQENRL